METFNESLSSNEELSLVYTRTPETVLFDGQVINNNDLTIQDNTAELELSLYNETLLRVLSANRLPNPLELEEPEEENEEDEDFNPDLSLAEFGAHPLILEDRNKALMMLAELLSAAQFINEQIDASLNAGPICPYEQTLLEYLGPNFKPPSIYDIVVPLCYSATESIKIIDNFSQKVDTQMDTHLQIMANEATDTNFPGITSQNIGNAFSVLSTTANGPEYVIDKSKLAQHLEFAELIRNIPDSYIDNNPIRAALQIVTRYTEIAGNF